MRKAVLGIDAAALARCQEKARGGHHLSGHWDEHRRMAMTKEYVRDEESRRRIEERTEQSTTARHFDVPAAKILEYAEFDEDERIACPSCGWSGLASEGDREFYAEVFDVSCPRCEKMLLVVSCVQSSEPG